MPDYLSETLGRQLPAMQLGASLADRSRNYQLDLAKYALQQQQSDINMRIQNLHYADALKESDAVKEDLPKWYQYNKDAQKYFSSGDLTQSPPAVPEFASTHFQNLSKQTASQIESLAPRFAAEKAAERSASLLQSANTALLNQSNKIFEDLQKADPTKWAELSTKYGSTLADPKTGRVNIDAVNQLKSEAVPILEKRKQEEDAIKAVIFASRIPAGVNLPEGTSVPGGQTELVRLATKPVGGTKQQEVEKIGIPGLIQRGLVDPKNPAEISFATEYLNKKLKAPAEDIKQIGAVDSAVSAIDSAMSLKNSFEKIHGEGSISKYIGPWDSAKINAQLVLQDGGTEQDVQDVEFIKRILNNNIVNYRNTKFGATLSPLEKESMEQIVSSVKRNDFFTASKQFGDVLKMSIKPILKRNKLAPNISDELKKQYAPEMFYKVEQGAPAAPSVGQPAGGIDMSAVEAEMKRRGLTPK